MMKMENHLHNSHTLPHSSNPHNYGNNQYSNPFDSYLPATKWNVNNDNEDNEDGQIENNSPLIMHGLRYRRVMEIVTVDLTVSADEPLRTLGMRLAPAFFSSAANAEHSNVVIIATWESSNNNNNKMGPIQRSGQVRLGDRLVQINGWDITHMTFRNIMDLLKDLLSHNTSNSASIVDDNHSSPVQLKSMGFVPLAQQQKQQQPQQQPYHSHKNDYLSSWLEGMNLLSSSSSNHNNNSNAISLRQDKQYLFSSNIASNRLQTTYPTSGNEQHLQQRQSQSDSFIEYEIKCQLVTRYSNSLARLGQQNKNNKKQWSIWRRFSEFKALDQQLRKSHGWQINSLNEGWGLKFPPSRNVETMVMGNIHPSFVQKRQEELRNYWDTLNTLPDLFDFTDPSSHRYCTSLGIFLNIPNHPKVATRRANNYYDDDNDSSCNDHSAANNNIDKNNECFSTTLSSSSSQQLYRSTSKTSTTSNDHNSNNAINFNNINHQKINRNVVVTPSSSMNTPFRNYKKKKRISGAAKSASERCLNQYE